MIGRLLFPYIVIIALNVALVVYIMHVSDTSNNSLRVIEEVNQVEQLIYNTSDDLRNYLVSGELHYLRNFEEGFGRLNTIINSSQGDSYSRVFSSEEINIRFQNYLNAINNLQNESELDEQVGARFQELNFELRRAEYSIDEYLNQINQEALLKVSQDLGSSSRYGVFFIIFGVIASIMSVVATVFWVIVPLRSLRTKIKKMPSSERAKIELKRKDEIGDLIEAYNSAIEELDQSEKELRNTNLNLKSANKELESFAYSVSHDLRSPLRSISGFSDALVRNYSSDLPEDAQDYLNRVHRAAGKMGELIDEILKLSRLSRKKLKRSEVDISKLAEEAVELLVPDHGAHLEISIQSGMKTYADEGLVEVLLLNLISNGIKFSSKKDQQQINIGTVTKKDISYFYVRDNGVGFNMKYVDKITGAFQRLHPNNEFEGTGIGLASVMRIINKHNGSLFFESEEGKGTTVFFNFGEEIK